MNQVVAVDVRKALRQSVHMQRLVWTTANLKRPAANVEKQRNFAAEAHAEACIVE
jgi:hypothetical protein